MAEIPAHHIESRTLRGITADLSIGVRLFENRIQIQANRWDATSRLLVLGASDENRVVIARQDGQPLQIDYLADWSRKSCEAVFASPLASLALEFTGTHWVPIGLEVEDITSAAGLNRFTHRVASKAESAQASSKPKYRDCSLLPVPYTAAQLAQWG